MNRPRLTDTEDDLLAMQEQFMKTKKEKSDASLVRMNKRREAGGQESEEVEQKVKLDIDGSRFTLRFDAEPSVVMPAENVLLKVEERNGLLLASNKELENMQKYAESAEEYSKDEGFPEVLDLSLYYSKEKGDQLAMPGGSSSFFAAEFDRLHGKISERSVDGRMDGHEEWLEANYDIGVENERRLASMKSEEVEKARKEIEEKLAPQLLEWLRDRHKRKAAPTDSQQGKHVNKVSRWKKERMESDVEKIEADKTRSEPSKDTVGTPSPQAADSHRPAMPLPPKLVEELIGNLEILEEYANREDVEMYDRLAIDAVRMELASRSMRFVLPRQEANAVRLFEMMKTKKQLDSCDPMLEEARTRMDEIKTLYLEVISQETGESRLRFAANCSPLTDCCWMLVPIRRVIDHIHSSKSACADISHVDTIRLSLLFSVLLFSTRPSAWATYTEAAEAYTRLAECFLIGPAVYQDDTIRACLSRLFSGYLLPAALNGLLTIRTTAKLAGLDSFAPFWDELLRSFESESSGCKLFSAFLLLPAYLNSSISDGVQLQLALWSPLRSVVRQMTISGKEDNEMWSLVVGAKSQSAECAAELEEALFVPYAQLLGCYLAGLREETVLRERNRALFELAADELGRFVERHTKGEKKAIDVNRAKEFDALVDIVRQTMASKISF